MDPPLISCLEYDWPAKIATAGKILVTKNQKDPSNFQMSTVVAKKNLKVQKLILKVSFIVQTIIIEF